MSANFRLLIHHLQTIADLQQEIHSWARESEGGFLSHSRSWWENLLALVLKAWNYDWLSYCSMIDRESIIRKPLLFCSVKFTLEHANHMTDFPVAPWLTKSAWCWWYLKQKRAADGHSWRITDSITVWIISQKKCGINEKESPFLFHLVCKLFWVHGMNTTFYTCLQSSAEMNNGASFLRFSFGYTESKISNESPQYFCFVNSTYSRWKKQNVIPIQGLEPW